MSKSTENIDLELKNSKPQATSSSTTLNVDECSNSSSINSEAGNLNIVIEEEATENNHEESANNTKSSKIESLTSQIEETNKTIVSQHTTASSSVVVVVDDNDVIMIGGETNATDNASTKPENISVESFENNNTTTDTSFDSGGRKSRRRTVNLGLDGNYWGKMETLVEAKPKRKRKTVERLYVGDVLLSVEDEGTKEEEVKSEKRLPKEENKEKEGKQSVNRKIFYKQKSFVAVRNESNGFFLCQIVNNVYENSKRIKIQWLEEENENEYIHSFEDWIQPQTIITPVSVKKQENKFFKIEDADLTKIKSLLDRAIKHGGIELENDDDSESEEIVEISTEEEEEEDDKKRENKKKRINSDELTNKNTKMRKIIPPVSDTSDIESVKTIKLKETDPYTFDDDRSSGSSGMNNEMKKAENIVESEKNPIVTIKQNVQSVTPKPKSSSSITITPSTNTKTHLENIRDKVIANIKKHEQIKKQQTNSSSSKTISTTAAMSQSLSLIATNKIKKDLINKKSMFKNPLKVESDESSASSTEKYSSENSSEFESNDGDYVKKKVKIDEKNKKSTSKIAADKTSVLHNKKTVQTTTNGTPKSTVAKNDVNKEKMAKKPANSNTMVKTAAEKKKLLKAISNGLLKENEKIKIYSKDPFFEDSVEIPYVSSEIQSKLAFRAIELDDMKLLQKLIDDRKSVSRLDCQKSIYNKITPLHFAIKVGRKEAVELLINEYLNETERVKMPKAMLSKFTTGHWNNNTFNAHYIRPLAQSRGSKEGNNAFLKDCEPNSYNFIQDLIDFCFQNNCSIEIFDYICEKLIDNKQFLKVCINSINKAVLNGNRKLAARVIDKCESYLNSEGFNNLHVCVLSYDKSEELKSQQLRTQTCLKKAFMNDSVTPLHFSCINPNTKYLKILINTTQEVNLADKRGRKLIHYAATCEDASTLEYLMLNRRLSQYECDSMGNTPLHYACISGRCANIEYLLENAKKRHNEDNLNVCTDDDIFKVDTKFGIGGINKPNRLGKNPLHLAVENGNYEAVRLLINSGCNLDYPMSNSYYKITALMYAVQLGFFKIVKLLHEKGARIESRDRLFRTPTMHACMCGSTKILSYLLHKGANANAFDSSGNTCIHYACAYGFYFCVGLLIEAGADCNSFNDWKLTPFGISYLKGHVGVCELLLTTNKIDINFRTENGETLIMLVVSNCLNKLTVDQITYMIKNLNANCNLSDSNGDNVLHYLARNKSYDKNDEKNGEIYREDMAKLLINNKCVVNCENNEFETPLFLAIKENNIQFAKYLILNHSNSIFEDDCINHDMNGNTLLHLICEFSLPPFNAFELIIDDNDFLLLKYLHKFKKMANIENNRERLPIHLAFISFKKYLINKQKEKCGQVPRNFFKFIELLYYSLESNVNKVMKIYKDEFNLIDKLSSYHKEEEEEEDFVIIPPLFLILNDECINLIEFILKISQQHIDTNLKIDFNAVDNDDCTIIHKAIINKQQVLCKFLISLGGACLDLTKFKHLNENLLHICIRNKLFEIYDILIQQFYDHNENFLTIIQEINLNRENILHLICSLLSQADRVSFGVERLEKLFELIFNKLNNNEEKYKEFKLQFLNVKDSQERIPLHLCLFNRRDGGNLDFEIFLVENDSNLFSLDSHKRIPLHYLFCNEIIDKNISLKNYSFKPPKCDPIELLTIIRKNMDLNDSDFSDIYGMTPLHYATMCGSTICCLHLIENSLLSPHEILFKPCIEGNSPLSLAIYYQSETCLLTLLKQITRDENKNEKFSLKSFYYYNKDNEEEEEEEEEEVKEEKFLNWLPKTINKNLFPLIKQTLYELILRNNWEGISWLILENAEKYGLTRLDTIYFAIKANNYSLALRLIGKYGKKNKATEEFYHEIHSQQDSETKRTLLHILCLKSAKINMENEFLLIKILNKLNISNTTIDFLLIKDSYNCTAIHYACYNHNFLILDYLFKQHFINNDNAHQLLTSKDGLEQTAFSLLFTSIGDIVYTDLMKEKISLYYKTYLKSTYAYHRINDNIKGYYNLIDVNNFGFINKKTSDQIEYYPTNWDKLTIGDKLMVNPFLFAINRQDMDMCKYLVKDLNFDINSHDGSNVAAIVYAIRVNNIDLVRFLLNTDYSVELKKQEIIIKSNNIEDKPLLFNIFNNNSIEEKDEDEEDEEEEEETNESLVEPLIENNDILNPFKFQIQTNINLFHLDSESKSIFHNLACTNLDYGSYSNLNICKLLLFCKKKFEQQTQDGQIEQQQNYFNDELRQIIKHLDKKSNTAIDYAIKYGNYEVADELRKFLNRDQVQQIHSKLPAFYVHDPNYAGPNAIHDFKYDSDELMRKLNSNSNDKLFELKVDENSKMEKNGEIYWDKEYVQPYDCLLTKTDISYGISGIHNFYKLQLIKQKYSHVNLTHPQSSLYILFTRWGRIGTVGQYQRTPFTKLDDAIIEFKKIFKQKTGNDFVDVALKKEKKFELKPKKYNYITFEMRKINKLCDLNFDLPTSSLMEFEKSIVIGETVECKMKNLEYVKFFMDLCDSRYLKERSTNESNIAFDYIPLSRLSRQVIENAFYLLTNDLKSLIDQRYKIEKKLVQNKTKDLVDEYSKLIENINLKSNQYYQLIPQFNYEFERLNPIDNYNEYEKHLASIMQLIDYQYAIKILMGAFNSLKTINPIDYIYNTINCKLHHMNENEAETQYILRYIWSSVNNFHKNSKTSIDIERIFKFECLGGGGDEELTTIKDLPTKSIANKNRYLLWHGTGTENMLSIMSKGLIKCPPESRKNGSRYGKGIYTSDVFTMSADYSHGKIETREKEYERKYMLLCEVTLGNVYELTNYQVVENAPEGFDSVKAVGNFEPNEQYTVQLPNGAKLPLGNLIESNLNESNFNKKLTKTYNQFNQYVVYDESQVCVRYIVQFRQKL